MYTRILVPIDGSQQADQALEHAIGVAASLSPHARLTVLHVIPSLTLNEPSISTEAYRALDEEDESIMAPAVSKLSQSGVSYETITAKGDPATVICETAKAREMELIVMGTRGVNLLSEILLGSVSHDVAKHAACPVLLVK